MFSRIFPVAVLIAFAATANAAAVERELEARQSMCLKDIESFHLLILVYRPWTRVELDYL